MSDLNTIDVRAYQEVAATASMRAMPRFGASNNFADLFESKVSATSYIAGLLFAGVFMFAVFFAWSVVLMVFKCLGKRKVGFLSGHAFTQADTSSNCSRPFISRLVFLNATLLFIIFSVLFVTQGITNLESTVVTVADTARDVHGTMEAVNSIMNRVEDIGNSTQFIARTFVSRLNNGAEECILAQFPNATQQISVVKARIQELRNFTPTELPELQNATSIFVNSSAQVEEQAENIEVGDWQSLIILIPFIIIPLVLLTAVGLAWFEIDVPMLRCAISWFFLPLFCLMTFMAYLISALFAIAGATNADFCSGGDSKSPDGTMIDIMYALNVPADDLVFRAVSWYVGQCTSDANPFDFVEVYAEQIADAKVELAQLALELENTGNEFVSDFCSQETNILNGLSSEMTENLVTLVGVVEDSLDLLSCKNVASLYTPLVYDGTCTYSVSGFAWAFGAFAAVATVGLTMLTLRSSWQLDVPVDNVSKQLEGPTKESDGEDDEYNGYDAGKENPEAAAEDDNQEQPAGVDAYGTLDDDGDDYGGMDADDNVYNNDDDFFAQRAEKKGSLEME